MQHIDELLTIMMTILCCRFSETKAVTPNANKKA